MSEDFGVLDKLPDDLSYLIKPAMQYGINQFDEDIDRFLDAATEEQMSELAAVAEKVRLNDHFELVNDWLNQYEIDQYQEAANLYFLFGILDAADLEFD